MPTLEDIRLLEERVQYLTNLLAAQDIIRSEAVADAIRETEEAWMARARRAAGATILLGGLAGFVLGVLV